MDHLVHLKFRGVSVIIITIINNFSFLLPKNILSPVFAEQKIQPLRCYLLPAGWAAQGTSLQLPRRTAAWFPPATAQHHCGTDCCQGEHRAAMGFWMTRTVNYPLHYSHLHKRKNMWPVHLFIWAGPSDKLIILFLCFLLSLLGNSFVFSLPHRLWVLALF